MKRILAIDQSSTQFGWAIGIDGKFAFKGFVKIPKTYDRKAKRHIYIGKISSLERKYDPDLIVLEEARVFQKYYSSIHSYAVIKQLTDLVIDKFDVPVKVVNTRHWRTIAIGDVNATKKQTVQAIERIYGVRCENDDEADAVGILMATIKGANLKTPP